MASTNANKSLAKTSKNAAARALATKHFELESGITHIFRIQTTEPRAAKSEPIRLLEVNENSVPAGIMPLHFGPIESIPYPSVIVEVTPAEYVQIKSQKLQLPEGWLIGEEIPRPKKLSESSDGN